MATILEFKPAPRLAQQSAAAETRAAEIVLFPGIRYERHAESKRVKPKKSKRRRDTLQLEG